MGQKMTKKRANGQGSVYRRKGGRVVGEWEDGEGRTRYVTSKTKYKAQMKAIVREKLENKDDGIVHDSRNLTIADYLGLWLESTWLDCCAGAFRRAPRSGGRSVGCPPAKTDACCSTPVDPPQSRPYAPGRRRPSWGTG